MEIELEINEINMLKSLIEQNLIMLDEVDFNGVVGDYKKANEAFSNLMDAIRDNTISVTDASLSLKSLKEMYNDFNSNLVNNYNITAAPCIAA